MRDVLYSYIEQSPQWRLFPVVDKLPAIKTGRDHAEHASTDPEQIERWLRRYTDFGMPTGAATGTVVIDVDAKHDGEAKLGELEEALGPLPRERVVRTRSGGLHVYCAHPGDGIRVRTSQGAGSPLGRLLGGRAGVDVRADGGIVVLPPSCGYRWIADDDTLPALPLSWLVAIQGEVSQSDARDGENTDRDWSSLDAVAVDTSPIGEGDRNGQLFRLGCALRRKGASDSSILGALEYANRTRCTKALPSAEVRKIAASAAKARAL